MLIRQKMVHEGNWLFRWRSFIPLLLAPLLFLVIRDFTFPGGSQVYDYCLEVLCLTLAFVGLGIRGHAIGHAAPGTSGANTRRQVAETLNTTGLYSVVRHPLYLGNALMWFSIFLFGRDLLVMAVVALFFAFYYERIVMAEEEFLEAKFGRAFREWASVTPAFIPDCRRWVPPSRPFNWRVVLRRDYGALMTVVGIFTLMEVGGDWVVEGKFKLEPVWAVLFFATLVFYGAIYYLKKRTRLLHPVR